MPQLNGEIFDSYIYLSIGQLMRQLYTYKLVAISIFIAQVDVFIFILQKKVSNTSEEFEEALGASAQRKKKQNVCWYPTPLVCRKMTSRTESSAPSHWAVSVQTLASEKKPPRQILKHLGAPNTRHRRWDVKSFLLGLNFKDKRVSSHISLGILGILLKDKGEKQGKEGLPTEILRGEKYKQVLRGRFAQSRNQVSVLIHLETSFLFLSFSIIFKILFRIFITFNMK